MVDWERVDRKMDHALGNDSLGEEERKKRQESHKEVSG